MKYYIERVYPYVFSGVITLACIIYKINFVNSCNLTAALDACNTVVALIIGFLGAILPVILGMKNESKIVKYIFENDKNKLFLKYIKATIFVGLVTLLISISLYFSKDIVEYPNASYWAFYIWVYLLICFILLTYRSLKNMLDLVFLSDNDLVISRYKDEGMEDEETKMIKDSFNEDI